MPRINRIRKDLQGARQILTGATSDTDAIFGDWVAGLVEGCEPFGYMAAQRVVAFIGAVDESWVVDGGG